MPRSVRNGRLAACSTVALVLAICTTAVHAAGPVRVEVVRGEVGWHLLRGGEPFHVKGAGGDASKEVLAACGGNSFRTWGVGDETEALLDEAERLGLAVTVGIWLGHERHGFDYSDVGQVAGQMERVARAVERLKNHPAVLMWALGNEMEGFAAGDNAAIWSHVESLAAMVKRMDPGHPTMTVIGELGGERISAIHRLCPSIDVVGINSYGGAPSVPQRYREAGGMKPYVVCEFGQPGVWEMGRNKFGTVDELTSTVKADFYRRAFVALEDDSELCLGSYAFAWGYKQEATATWYGMFLPDGSKLAAVDAMTELWSGESAENLCPRMDDLKVEGEASGAPGTEAKVVLHATDPEGDPLRVDWVLRGDAGDLAPGGDHRNAPLELDRALVRSDTGSAVVRLPDGGGLYRLFAYVHDGQGGAAVGNVVLQVVGPRAARGGKEAILPLSVLAGDAGEPPFAPSGWMGSADAIRMDAESTDGPHAGQTCLRIDYALSDAWGGVAWQDPPEDWGAEPGGYDLTGATRLRFWARGREGGETVKLGFGLIGHDRPYHDTARAEIEVTLEQDWRQYAIDLTGQDLSRIKTGFYWVAAGQGAPITFYLDDVAYE